MKAKESRLKNTLFGDITEKTRDKAIEEIIESSSPTKSFFVMTTIAAILCTLGILANNSAVIIGGMMVAPVLSPILAISVGIGTADFKCIRRSVKVALLVVLYSIIFSFLTALLLEPPAEINHEMSLRIGVNLEVLLVALVAGVAASLSIVRSELRKYLVGVAIAVALIPPLSMSAIALRMLDFEIFYGSLMQSFFNFCGVVLSSLLIFSLSRFHVSKWKVRKELREEEEMFKSGKEEKKRQEEKEEKIESK